MVSAYCQQCGAGLAPGALFCGACGATVADGGVSAPSGGGWGAATALTPAYAGFGARLGGAIIDGLILAVPNVIIFIALVLPVLGSIDFATFDGAFSGDTERSFRNRLIGAQLVWAAIGIAYYTLTIGGSGQTLGGRAVGLRVLAVDGKPLRMSAAFIRALVRVGAYGLLGLLGGLATGLGFVNLLILLAYLWMLWDAQKQTWHDKAAGSIVVKAT